MRETIEPSPCPPLSWGMETAKTAKTTKPPARPKKLFWFVVSFLLLGAMAVLVFFVPTCLERRGPGGVDSEIDLLNSNMPCDIYWNGTNVTNQIVSTTSEFSAAGFCLVQIQTQDSMNLLYNPPVPIFSVGDLYRLPDIGYITDAFGAEVGRLIGVAWENGHWTSTYAQNGKRIPKMTFSGFDENELFNVSHDGLVLSIKKPGERVLFCEIEDNCGAITSTSIRFHFI